jgi:hypothetical protein
MTSTAQTSSPKSGAGFGYPLGFVAAVAATVVSVAAGAAGHHGYAVVALTLVVAGVAATTSLRAALGTAVVAWGLQAGFVIGRTGGIVFDAESARDAVVFTAAGLLVGGAAAALHAARAHTAPLAKTVVTTVVNEPPTLSVNAVPAPSTCVAPAVPATWRAASSTIRTPVAPTG